MDTFPTGAVGFGDLFEEFLTIDHWNIAPYPTYIGVKNYIGAGFSFGARFSFNSIKQYGDTPASDNYYNVDGIVSYNLNTLFKGKTLMPFLEVGGGYSIFDEQGAGYFNLGAGIEIWLGPKKKTALTLETIYKNTGETYGVKHFQHLMGLAFLFGAKKDLDGDGIPDKEDACPQVAGLIEFNGCPDTDGDGIQDAEDDCPEVAGIASWNGCPDTDGDGIQDEEDDCPNTPGIPAFNRCPDTDGVKDLEDQCPDEAGTIENDGCPEITQEIIERLQEIGKIIYFATNDSKLNERNNQILDEVFNTLQNYSSYKVVVEGHTDSSGQASFNQALSEKRANSVMRYLIEKGMSPSRASAKGYGETRPAVSNDTAEGRRENRRVVFEIYQ
ncbi:MAG: OmpA family protein [Flavobacteriaceae bacterium]|nr:OmpA family protein [Flavobacteriaceae bacterium]MDG1920086.1 OmpA family protein [Flavobacteriaceae bacterium]